MSYATSLETTRGVINVGDSKVILALGTLPTTALVLNSFPQVKNAGSRFSAHFISAIFARVPRVDYNFHNTLHKRPANEGLELAAIYLAGVDKRTGGQFHVQLMAVFDTNPNDPAHLQTAARNMPDVVATASQEQLRDSRDHIVFVCAVLGELDYSNDRNWFRRNDGSDLITDVTLQVLENSTDRSVWDAMDESTFRTLEQVLSPKGQTHVEYWHGSPEKGEWKRSRQRRTALNRSCTIKQNEEFPQGGDIFGALTNKEAPHARRSSSKSWRALSALSWSRATADSSPLESRNRWIAG